VNARFITDTSPVLCSKTEAGEFFCALNCLTRIRTGFGICQHDSGNSRERKFISPTVGPNCPVMELIEGARPKGPLPLGHTLKNAAQICDP
jgi:hypothetical protein